MCILYPQNLPVTRVVEQLMELKTTKVHIPYTPSPQHTHTHLAVTSLSMAIAIVYL